MELVKGARVISTHADAPGLKKGEYGTFVGYSDWGDIVIKWEEFNRARHDSDGMVPSGHGWYINEKCIELVPASICDLGEFSLCDKHEVESILFGL